MPANIRETQKGGSVAKKSRVVRASLVLFGAVLGLMFQAGCSRGGNDASAEATKGRYPLTGEVLSIDAERNVLIVRHDEIPGFMPAMTMEFAVTRGDIATAKEGQRIRATLVEPETEGGDWKLEQIWPDDQAAKRAVEAKANALRQETLNRGRSAYREIGENMPEFALYDQTGAVVDSGKFRGKKVMLNFIFTRCPIATMCPAATVKMTQVQKLAREAGVTNVQLVSITLDPAYDTPGVLKEYADTRGIDTSNFTFLTGPENAIKDLLANFGVIAEFEGDLIKHTLATILIDENGRILHRTDHSAWEPRDFMGKMTK